MPRSAKNSMNNNKLNASAAVLFDCDGVIANSEEIMFAAGYEYIRAHGLEYTRREFAAISIGGMGPQSYVSVLAQEYHRVHDRHMPHEWAEDYCLRVYGALEERLTVVPGVDAVLENLKAAGIPCAVGTNAGETSTRHKLQTLGLTGYFNQHVYSWDNGARPKPHPDIYQDAAAGLGCAPQDCIVIDDSATGVKAGVAAGATVIGFTGGEHRDEDYGRELRAAGAHYTAQTMAQVEDIIMRRFKGGPSPGPQRG